jgi:hypothetical protein
MNRRRALTGIAALAAWIMLAGQTPSLQWKRGRGGDLLLHSNREDPGSTEVGEMLANRLRKILPDSGARVAPEPTPARIASAMSTGQGGLTVMAYDIALEMYRGAAPFQKFGPIELRVLVENYKFQVLCLADFEREHAYLVAQALMGDPEPLKLTVPDRPVGAANRDSIPSHPGALAFLKGTAL